ncbi:hypothetical protein ABIA19_000983 [Sinorhizobium fredii]
MGDNLPRTLTRLGEWTRPLMHAIVSLEGLTVYKAFKRC